MTLRGILSLYHIFDTIQANIDIQFKMSAYENIAKTLTELLWSKCIIDVFKRNMKGFKNRLDIEAYSLALTHV